MRPSAAKANSLVAIDETPVIRGITLSVVERHSKAPETYRIRLLIQTVKSGISCGDRGIGSFVIKGKSPNVEGVRWEGRADWRRRTAGSQALAEIVLPPGRFELTNKRIPMAHREFTISSPGRLLNLCSDSTLIPSTFESRVACDEFGQRQCGVQRIILQACCRRYFHKWRTDNAYALACLWSLKRTWRVEVAGRMWKVAVGEYVVANPLECSAPADDQSWPLSLVKVVVFPPLLHDIRNRLRLPRTFGPFDFQPGPRRMSSLLARAMRAAEQLLDEPAGPGAEEMVRNACQGVVVRLLEEHPNGLMAKRHPEAATGHDPRLVQVVERLRRHRDGRWSLKQAAGEVGVTVRWLHRRMRQVFGCSPKIFEDRLRMERAEELLADSSNKIEEVARLVGFKTVRGFRIFHKKMTGRH